MISGEEYRPGVTPEDESPGNQARQNMMALLAEVTAAERRN